MHFMKLLFHIQFFHGGSTDNFDQACFLFSLSLNNNNREFIAFLISGIGQNMTNNSLSIHIESGNNFYHNLNTNENFCSFFLAQEDDTKAIIPKPIS